MSSVGISQPTLFRWAKAQSDSIVALGARRNRKLAALRNVRSLESRIPIFRITEDGSEIALGQILALYPSSFAIIPEEAPLKPLLYPGLPFFLDDAKPQGFLGRFFMQNNPELRLPSRILDWNNDDILEAIARRGEDLVGDLLIGAESFERYQEMNSRKVEVISARHPENQYVKFAQAAIDGEPVGSSAGGEHPKFGATLKSTDGTIKKVLVKFSPLGETFAARRWRDLLICEALALDTLRTNGIAAAENRIVEGGGRVFLETTRFDRLGARGRKGMLSLAAVEDEWTGHAGNWAVSTALLAGKKMISLEDLKTVQKLECFGRLIGNSDRHPGNLSFFWRFGRNDLTLAPAYDMLPMLYAPSSGGEDTSRTFSLPTYDHTLLFAWKETIPMAIQYWESVRAHSDISKEFKKIAERNLKIVSSE